MFNKLKNIAKLESIKLISASVLYAVFFYIAFYHKILSFMYIALPFIFYILFKNISFKKKFLYTWLASFLSILFSMKFVPITIIEFSRISTFFAIVLFIIFSLFSTGALLGFVSFSHLLLKKTKKQNLIFIFVLPLGIVFTEFLDWKVFPWQFGAIFSYNLYLSQFANVVGEIGLSYMIFLYGLLLYLVVKGLVKKDYKQVFKLISIFLVLNLFQFLYGYYFIKIHSKSKSTGTVNTLIVQANIGNSAKLSIEQRIKLSMYLKSKASSRQSLILNTYMKLTEDNIAGMDIAFWPETAFPSRYTEGFYYSKKMDEFIERINKTIIFGSYYGRKLEIFNSVISKSPQTPYEVYNKQILLPFGEYMPLGEEFPILYKWFPDVSHFGRGKKDTIFDYKGFKILPIICYESWFPIFVSRKVRDFNADLILHITNDSWFSVDGADYHVSFSKMRAIENNRPMLRVTNTGHSAYIDSFGRVLQKTEFGTVEVLKAKIPKIKRPLTIYSLCAKCLLILLISIYFIYAISLFRRKNV